MSKSSRRRNLNEANASVRAIAKNLAKLESVFEDDAYGRALPSAADGPGPRNGISDRTGTAAIADSKQRAQERQLDRLLSSAAKTLTTAERIVAYWTTEIPAKVEELAALERAADPGCEVLGRLGGWEPVYKAATTVGGRLQRPYRLCLWVYKFVGTYDRLPTEAESRTHIGGRRVFAKASA